MLPPPKLGDPTRRRHRTVTRPIDQIYLQGTSTTFSDKVVSPDEPTSDEPSSSSASSTSSSTSAISTSTIKREEKKRPRHSDSRQTLESRQELDGRHEWNKGRDWILSGS